LRHHIGVGSQTPPPDLGSHRHAKPDKRITAIPARARFGEHPTGHRGKSERVVEFAMGDSASLDVEYKHLFPGSGATLNADQLLAGVHWRFH